MTEESELTHQPNFVAVVSLSLSNMEEAVTAHVTLTPTDEIPVNGRSKPLPECTLEDLHQFAEALEAAAWETYQQIQLTELVEDEDVAVKLDILDEDGEPIPPSNEWNWANQLVLLADVLDEVVDNEEIETTTEDELVDEVEDELDAPPVEDVPETAVSEEPPPQSDEDLINIIVASTESIHEEREAEEPTPISDESAVIAPSKARVRVAGKRLEIGANTNAAVDILMDEPALRASQAHALSSMNREVAGVLVGPRPEKQPDGRYVVQVIDTIVAKHTVMQGASVTYTPESWRYMTDKLWEKYPDDTAVIVGWYHTHPGFGIFLSGMDLFIHQNFFTQIWHIAYVLDPRARTSGFFSWDRQKTQVSRHNFQWPYWAASSW